jgi:hypothetical protein
LSVELNASTGRRRDEIVGEIENNAHRLKFHLGERRKRRHDFPLNEAKIKKHGGME